MKQIKDIFSKYVSRMLIWKILTPHLAKPRGRWNLRLLEY